MPRLNKQRPDASEANLAKRIAYERERMGLSFEAFAKLMTEAGCPIQGSAIYRIEKGDPPRRVTVDELVALAAVLEEDVVDALLRPISEVQQERADQVAAEFEDALSDVSLGARRVLELLVEWARLRTADEELSTYIVNRIKAGRSTIDTDLANPVVPANLAAKLRAKDVELIEQTFADLINRMSAASTHVGRDD